MPVGACPFSRFRALAEAGERQPVFSKGADQFGAVAALCAKTSTCTHRRGMGRHFAEVLCAYGARDSNGVEEEASGSICY